MSSRIELVVAGRADVPWGLIGNLPSVYTYTALITPYTYIMKTKLTLTIDEELIPRAKEIARSRDVSLSHLVESGLRALVKREERTFASRWIGKFEPADRDDPRYDSLAEKYL